MIVTCRFCSHRWIYAYPLLEEDQAPCQDQHRMLSRKITFRCGTEDLRCVTLGLGRTEENLGSGVIFCQEKALIQTYIHEFDQGTFACCCKGKHWSNRNWIKLKFISPRKAVTLPTRVPQSGLWNASLEIIPSRCIKLAIDHAWHICAPPICNRHALSRLVAQIITNHMAEKSMHPVDCDGMEVGMDWFQLTAETES